jgi:general secretion pathway protein G
MTAIRSRKGFTLIEILIVVIILGILAAIVIPQFSSATTDARTSSVQSTVQTLRSQVALYRLQHNDKLPGSGSGTSFTAGGAQFWTDLTTQTDATGTLYASGATTGPFGPYMQDIPANALNTLTSVIDGAATTTAASACGYQYDFTAKTGKVWGTGTDSKTFVQP